MRTQWTTFQLGCRYIPTSICIHGIHPWLGKQINSNLNSKRSIMARGSSKPLEYVDNYKKICCKKRFSKKILVYLLIDQNVCNFTKFWTTEVSENVQKNVDGMECPAIDALPIGYHSFSLTSMVMNSQVKRCFVNKQLTKFINMDLLHRCPHVVQLHTLLHSYMEKL